ncbi:FAD-linked oxidase C-terminal domain-containing protein, partial [Mycolicibacterium austroafricanum]|uniref:FAD-linked oxidase C-terminal domain-containing protein n=1 Tax=Mycolicibacterium austroafricanum TaxID=39687 RepID=UPI00235016DD
ARHGGNVSSEHGVGTRKRDYLSMARTEADIAAMRTVKAAFDPDDELYWADGEDEYVEYEVPWDDGAEPRRPAQEADTVDA